MATETYLWRMHLNTDSATNMESAFDFCRARGVLGFGWKLYDANGEPIVPKDIDECLRLGREQYSDSTRGFTTAINAFKEMEVNDLIWVRKGGDFYLYRVTGEWRYEASDEHLAADVVNVIPCEFVEVGTVEEVPGKVVNCLRSTSTVNRIHGEGHEADGTELNPALCASMRIYNRLTGMNRYPAGSMRKDNVIDMLQAEDVEEVISLYLQAERGYYLYSSSNKLDTQAYEFVMVHPSDGHKACAQVKTGNVTLDGDKYAHLPVKVYLYADSGNYMNVGHPNVEIIDKDTIIEFMFAKGALLPKRIGDWLDQVAVPANV